MNIGKIRDFFYGDKYLRFTGVEIEEADDGASLCTLDIEPERHNNMGNVVQGGVTYTLADSAFAVASNAGFVDRGEQGDRITVSQSATITYFKPPRGSKLICRARALTRGRVSSVYQMDITDDLGTRVAQMIGNAYTVELKR
jgi:acyl-CoA thioesterase